MFKKTTRLSALFLALVMVLSVVMAVPNKAYAAEKAFEDVEESHALFDYVKRVEERRFYEGDKAGNFNAEGPMTRAQVAKVLVRAEGIEVDEEDRPAAKPFKDVAADHQLAAYILAAKKAEIFLGDADGNFHPEKNITRGQAAAVVVRTLGFEMIEENAVDFIDVSTDHTFAAEIAILASQGIVSGFEGKFDPEANVTRAQFAKYLVNGVTFQEADQVVAEYERVLTDSASTQQEKATALANAQAAKNALLEAGKKAEVQDNTDILTAKTNIESAIYSSTQAEVRDEAAALTKVQALVDSLELKGTIATVVAGTFTTATAGSKEKADGTPGSYNFTVTIGKGKGPQVTSAELTMTIIATTYEEEQIRKINSGSSEIIPVSVYEAAGITGFSDNLLEEIENYIDEEQYDLLQVIIQTGRSKKGWTDLTKAEIQNYVTLLSELFKYDMYTEGHIKGDDTAVGTDITDKVMVLYEGETAATDIELEFVKYDGPMHEWYEDYYNYAPNVIEIINNRIVIKELISYREEYYTEDTIPVYLRLKKNDLMIEWVMEFFVKRQNEID